jgi:hypothetical protein
VRPRTTRPRPQPHGRHPQVHFSLKERWRRALWAGFRAGCGAAFAVGAGCAVYLTLRRSSDLRTVWWIPFPVARWADYHGRTRNLVAYALLATPILILTRDRSKQLKWLSFLGLFGTALEYGQLFIPTRWFEWQDIALSLAGLAASWLVVEGARWAAGSRRRPRSSSYPRPR